MRPDTPAIAALVDVAPGRDLAGDEASDLVKPARVPSRRHEPLWLGYATATSRSAIGLGLKPFHAQ